MTFLEALRVAREGAPGHTWLQPDSDTAVGYFVDHFLMEPSLYGGRAVSLPVCILLEEWHTGHPCPEWDEDFVRDGSPEAAACLCKR